MLCYSRVRSYLTSLYSPRHRFFSLIFVTRFLISTTWLFQCFKNMKIHQVGILCAFCFLYQCVILLPVNSIFAGNSKYCVKFFEGNYNIYKIPSSCMWYLSKRLAIVKLSPLYEGTGFAHRLVLLFRRTLKIIVHHIYSSTLNIPLQSPTPTLTQFISAYL